MKKSLFPFFALLFIVTLSSQRGDKPQLTNLNLPEAFSQQSEVPLSRFIDKISYIPLETNPEVVISGTAHIEVADEFVIVRQGGNNQKYQILLFDRNSGKFLREIGKHGRGPGEYSIYSRIPFNEVKNELYAISPSREILVYDLFGKNIDKIKVPDPKIKNEILTSTSIIFENMLDNNIFVGYIPNISGFERRKLVLFSKDGFLKVFPNYMTWNRGDFKGIIIPPMGNFANLFIWNNKLNFIEPFCDTRYQVTKESLLPRYFFDSGKFHITYSKQADLSKNTHVYEYFFITDIDENKDFIFIQLFYNKNTFTGFIDKSNNNITFCKKEVSDYSGLTDDISGLMDVVPLSFTQNNEMVWIVQPVSLINWLKENPEKAAVAKSKLLWLNHINEFSNPVIAIGSCK